MINDFRRVLNMTHLVRIPLLNQTSSNQIQETLWRVASDPVAASVPPLAYRPFLRLRCGIVTLSLPTEEKRNQAISLLQHLGDQNWQKIFFRAPEARSNTPIASTVTTGRLSSEHVDQFRPRPLVVSALFEQKFASPCHASVPSHITRADHFHRLPNCQYKPKSMPQAILISKSQVDVVGLGDHPLRHSPPDLKSTMSLSTFIKEPSGLFRSFCDLLSREFYAAGLAPKDPRGTDITGLKFLQTKCIDTRGLKSGIPNLKPTLKGMHVDMVPRFDARDLRVKFGDVVWAKDVHLDRVCISELIPDDIVEDGQLIGARYRDIVSIPLPGVTWEPRSFEYMRIPHRWATAESQGSDRA